MLIPLVSLVSINIFITSLLVFQNLLFLFHVAVNQFLKLICTWASNCQCEGCREVGGFYSECRYGFVISLVALMMGVSEMTLLLVVRIISALSYIAQNWTWCQLQTSSFFLKELSSQRRCNFEHVLGALMFFPWPLDSRSSFKCLFVASAGSVFLGPWTPESVGDYASGTNHVLPTYGYARMYGGVSLDSFLKYITVQSLTEEGLRKLGPYVATMAEVEGLDAHKLAVTLRLKDIEGRQVSSWHDNLR